MKKYLLITPSARPTHITLRFASGGWCWIKIRRVDIDFDEMSKTTVMG